MTRTWNPNRINKLSKFIQPKIICQFFVHTRVQTHINTHTHTHTHTHTLYIYDIILKYEGPRRDLYFFNLFICSYIRVMYVSSLLLSLENMCGTMPFKWGTQWDLNSLLFPVSCLVRLFYIRVLVPLSWSVFTLVCFTLLWYWICL